MLIVAAGIGYAALVFWGGRRLLAKGQRGGAVLYAGSLVYCAYLSMAALRGAKALTPSGLYMAVFRPVGQWLDALLGGA